MSLQKIVIYLGKQAKGLKYCCPQKHYIRNFSFYLFQSNEIDNVGNFQQQTETLIILLTHVKVLMQNENDLWT